MIENDITLLEGAQYRMRVTLTDEAGTALDPALFRVYAGAFCPGFAPVNFHAVRTDTEWQLTMPGLKAGRVPWSWQVVAAEVATGVEWLLAGGEIEPVPRHAVGAGYVDPGELSVQATLDKTTLQMTVTLGESTAACSLAVVDARQSAAEAAASAEAAAGSATESGQQASAAASSAAASAASAAAAAASAEAAEVSASNAAASAAAAADSASDAIEAAEAAAGSATAAADSATAAADSATAAAGSATAAAGHASAASGSASNAAASAAAAADSASDAIEAAEAAAGSATAAADSATATAASAEAAAGSATAAADSATAAASSADAAAETLAGAAQVAENNTFTGTNTFNGTVVANGTLQATAGIATDSINGIDLSDWTISDEYNDITTLAELERVFPDYNTQKIWRWRMDAMKEAPLANNTNLEYCIVTSWPAVPSMYKFFSGASNLRAIDIYAPAATFISWNYSAATPKLKSVILRAPKVNYMVGLWGYGNHCPALREMRLHLNAMTKFDTTCIWNYGGAVQTLKTFVFTSTKCTDFSLRMGAYASLPNLVNLTIHAPLLTKINLHNVSNMLSKSSFIHLVGGLLTWDESSGTAQPQITIDLPSALQVDADVVAAIAELDAKGWTDYTASDGTIYNKINWV